MELLRDTNYDFMKYRKFWVVVSLALVLAGIVSIFWHGRLNLGIDFAGGTQINLKFRETPDVDRLRTVLNAEGLSEAVIQSVGDPGDNEVMIRTRIDEKAAEGTRDRIVAALDKQVNPDRGPKVDLNRAGADVIAGLLVSVDPEQRGAAGVAHYQGIAEAIANQRREQGLFTSMNDVAKAPGVSPAIRSTLEQQAYLGNFTVRSVDAVGPQIGGELRRQGFLAVALSLVGMLVYIWFRFELRFGIGAVMACLHDVLVTLFFFTLMGFEFNLTTVAAFLTLIGYSVNDTVVIFDRIRENMRKNRREPLITVMNRSINETLSRTLLTGGSTLLVLACLFKWGGDVIRGFAFVMLVGIIAGTYSSIYVASPFTLLWEQVLGNRGSKLRGGASPAPAGSPATGRAPEAPQRAPRPSGNRRRSG